MQIYIPPASLHGQRPVPGERDPVNIGQNEFQPCLALPWMVLSSPWIRLYAGSFASMLWVKLILQLAVLQLSEVDLFHLDGAAVLSAFYRGSGTARLRASSSDLTHRMIDLKRLPPQEGTSSQCMRVCL